METGLKTANARYKQQALLVTTTQTFRAPGRKTDKRDRKILKISHSLMLKFSMNSTRR